MSNELIGEFDATKWAEKFVERVNQKHEIATDERAMVVWFANAIMAGYDRRSEEIHRLEGLLKDLEKENEVLREQNLMMNQESVRLEKELKQEYLKETHLQKTFCGKKISYWFGLEKEVKDYEFLTGYSRKECRYSANRIRELEKALEAAIEVIKQIDSEAESVRVKRNQSGITRPPATK